MENWQGHIIACIVGLLIGIERERLHPDQKVMGVRTFLFIALLGALAGDLTMVWAKVLISTFALSLIVVAYAFQVNPKNSQADRGLTTEFAAGIVYCLGLIAHSSPLLVSVLGPAIALLLLSKKTLHQFIHTIHPNELEAALLLLLGGVAVINLVPDTTIDPWNLFNPRKFSVLILIIATLEFFSYVVVKIIGNKKGALFAGLFGGLVSSTAVLLAAAKNAKKIPLSWRSQLSLSLTAQLSSLGELLLIIGLVAPEILKAQLYTILPPIFIGLVALYFIFRKNDSAASIININSPLDWRGSLRLAIYFMGILLIISLAKFLFGEKAGTIVSFLTGLFELQGASLANATMYNQGQLSLMGANQAITSAVIASILSKMAIAWMIERGTFAKALTLTFLPMILLIAACSWWIST
jgi:uncharacterized membrane protein (DUF4010 family)